jgi:hypothetical protein
MIMAKRKETGLIMCGHFAACFAQRNWSIPLDMHAQAEQDHVEVSPFAAKLPLFSPNAVSIKGQAPH